MRRQCTLIICHSCNLNCIYCYERFKNRGVMTIETAKSIITHELSTLNTDKYDGLEVNFIGGEPLLNFELIKSVCEWAYNLQNIHFSIITNGTLFDTEKRLWFEHYRDIITVDVSVDGIDTIQQTNRGCEIKQIPIDWIQKNWPNNRYKMTISKESLPQYAQSIIHLEEKGFRTMPTLAIGVDWNSDDASTYAQQLHHIVEHFITQQISATPSFLLQSVDGLFDENTIVYKSCQTGDTSITYDIDGTAYPCIIFSPLVLEPSDNNWRNINFMDENNYIDPECKDCFIKKMCKTCYGYNYQRTGQINNRDKRMCDMYKTEIYYIAKFQKLKIENSSLNRDLTLIETLRLSRVNSIIQELHSYEK